MSNGWTTRGKSSALVLGQLEDFTTLGQDGLPRRLVLFHGKPALQAERYTRAADRKRLGLTGSRRINRSEEEQKSLTSDPANAR